MKPEKDDAFLTVTTTTSRPLTVMIMTWVNFSFYTFLW